MNNPEKVLLAGLFILIIYGLTTSIGASSIIVNGDSNLSFLDLNDTPNSYSGQANKFVAVNAGETGLSFTTASASGDTNCSNNANCILTGTILTANKSLFNADVNINADLNILGSKAINFGGPTPDFNLYNVGADDKLYLRKKTAGTGTLDANNLDFLINNMGVCNSPISPNAVINGNCFGSQRAVLNFIYTSTGGSTVNAILSQAQWRQTGAPSATGVIATAFLDTNINATGTITGLFANHGIGGTNRISGGTLTTRGIHIRNQPGYKGDNNGGLTLNQMLYIATPIDYNDNPATNWGIVSNGDIQLNSGNSLLLEGTDSTKGDTNFTYINGGLDLKVDNNKIFKFDNNATTLFVPLVPDANNNVSLGTNNTKFNSLYVVNAFVGDLIFSNGMYFKEPSPQETCLYSDKNNLIACFNESGITMNTQIKTKPTTASKPLCDPANEGSTWLTKGTIGKGTLYEMCIMKPDGSYGWNGILSTNTTPV